MPAAERYSVLLVEDDESLRDMLARCLVSGGEYEVRLAGSVAEARAALFAGPEPSVIVSDLRLPDESGEDLLRWARDRDMRVPFVLMTAYHTFEHAVEAYRLGAVRYLAKPFDLRAFMAALREAVEMGDAPAMKVQDVFEPARGWVEIAGPSTGDAGERLREFISVLASTSLSRQALDELRLAVEEMVQNAIEWGNRNDPRRRIRVAYAIFTDRILVMVRDEGSGFDYEHLPDPTVDPIGHLKERLATGKRIGGYGIRLTREMVDDVTYSASGNVVILTKYLGRQDTA